MPILLQFLFGISDERIGQQREAGSLKELYISRGQPLDLLFSYLLKFGCRRFDEGKILMASRYLATVRRAIPIA